MSAVPGTQAVNVARPTDDETRVGDETRAGTRTPADVLGARGLATPTVDPVVVALYGLLAVAATGRSVVQLAGHAGDAPLAYGLSAVAAGFYVVAGFALRRIATSRWALPVARAVCSAELAGVVAVGALTVAVPSLFPQDTVWSTFGAGYGFAPLVLPAVALAMLRRPSSTTTESTSVSRARNVELSG